jgi:hypothetical protein
MSVVFRENFLLHITKRSSMDGPSKSMTIRLDLYSLPCQRTRENPIEPSMFLRIFDSACSWRCFAF